MTSLRQKQPADAVGEREPAHLVSQTAHDDVGNISTGAPNPTPLQPPSLALTTRRSSLRPQALPRAESDWLVTRNGGGESLGQAAATRGHSSQVVKF